MTPGALREFKSRIIGTKPGPRVFAALEDGTIRRVLSIGGNFVKIYWGNRKTRVDAAEIKSLEVFDG